VSIVSMTAAVSQTSRPNLLWIMADDLGVGEPSFLSSETAVSSGRVIHTPRIDELAASGTFFTAAYAGYTVCAPSRATLFTGRSVGRLAGAPANWPLLPRLLGDAGYQTALFGKSAPMDDTTPGSELEWGLPARFGFERFRGDPNQAQCHNMYPTYLVDDTSTLPLPLNTKNKSRSLCMAHPQDYNYTTDVFTDAALHWLHSERLPTKPFFLYIAYTVPHAGGWGSAPSSPEQGSPVPSDLQYADRDWPEVERDHAASVTYLDLKLGRVLDGLDTLGLSTSTAVFFASDNGAHNEGGHDVRFFDSSRGLRGFKRSFYEGGVRSPSIIRWPGVTQPGTISATPWAFWDVLPTMLDMAGAQLPAGATLDGRSIVPALRGEPQPAPKYLYWTWVGLKDGTDAAESLVEGGGGGDASGAVPGYAARVGDWKAVVHACANTTSLAPSMADTMELYNLSADPLEANEVGAQHSTVIDGIKRMLSTEGLSCKCYQCGM